jgi:hypothetical protein
LLCSKGWREKIKVTWEERRNPAKDEIFISRRQSWAGEGLAEEALEQLKKEAGKETQELADWLSKIARKTAYHQSLGARERIDSAMSFHEIVQDFASRTSRSRASTLESSDDASILVILSNEESYTEKFPHNDPLYSDFYETSDDEMNNDETTNDELINNKIHNREIHTHETIDKHKIQDEIFENEIPNNEFPNQQPPRHALKTKNLPLYTFWAEFAEFQGPPTLSRRQSCPGFLLHTLWDDPLTPLDPITLLHTLTEWDHRTIYASDSISQYSFSAHNQLLHNDDASEYSHITGDSFYVLDKLRKHSDGEYNRRVREKLRRCYENARRKKERARFKMRVKMERKLRWNMEKKRLRNKWKEYKIRIRERERELRDRGRVWKERIRGSLIRKGMFICKSR